MFEIVTTKIIHIIDDFSLLIKWFNR